jgi:hypothetical protein
VLGGDRMGSNTQVPVVMRVWAPAVMSCLSRHLMPPLPKAPALAVPT